MTDGIREQLKSHGIAIASHASGAPDPDEPDDHGEFNRLNRPDPDRAKLKPDEADAAVEFQKRTRITLNRSETKNSGDFWYVDELGETKSLDFMYSVEERSVAEFNKFFPRNFRRRGPAQIIKHVTENDTVVMDFRNLNEINQQTVVDFLKTLPKNMSGKIRIMD